jgi:hypothetical protein
MAQTIDDHADILGAEKFLDFPQILSQLVEQDRGCGWRNPCAVISPTPRALQAARSRKLTARFKNGRPRISRKHKLLGCEDNPAGSQDAAKPAPLVGLNDV